MSYSEKYINPFIFFKETNRAENNRNLIYGSCGTKLQISGDSWHLIEMKTRCIAELPYTDPQLHLIVIS